MPEPALDPAPEAAPEPEQATAVETATSARETNAEPEPTTHERSPGVFRGLMGFLVRLVVLVAVVAGIGGGIYFSWPIVYDRVIAPVQTNTSDLGALRERIAQLEAEVATLSATDATARADLAALADRLADHDRRLETLAEMDATLAASDEAASETVARQVRLLKGMELMSRARLFLYQSNFGLAEQDLAAARAILGDLRGGDVDGQAVISVAVERLDRAIEALPLFPVAASDELDIAWQALLGKVPVPEATAQPEPSASATPAPNVTPEPAPSATP